MKRMVQEVVQEGGQSVTLLHLNTFSHLELPKGRKTHFFYVRFFSNLREKVQTKYSAEQSQCS
jgi:hypothetical protein